MLIVIPRRMAATSSTVNARDAFFVILTDDTSRTGFDAQAGYRAAVAATPRGLEEAGLGDAATGMASILDAYLTTLPRVLVLVACAQYRRSPGAPMSPSASVIVFDVNETLSDMSPMAGRFADIGAPEHLAKLWFATLLRDGFAATAAGAHKPFAELGVAALGTVLQGFELNRDLGAATAHVMDGFSQLTAHPDVPEGVRALRRSGHRLVTLTNGATEVAERLFSAAGIRDEFEALLSVEDAGAWKPARASYEYAARTCGTERLVGGLPGQSGPHPGPPPKLVDVEPGAILPTARTPPAAWFSSLSRCLSVPPPICLQLGGVPDAAAGGCRRRKVPSAKTHHAYPPRPCAVPRDRPAACPHLRTDTWCRDRLPPPRARPIRREPARDVWVSPGAHAVRCPDRPPWCPTSRSARSSQQLTVSDDGSDSATPAAARRRRRTNDSCVWPGPFEPAGSCWPTAPPRR